MNINSVGNQQSFGASLKFENPKAFRAFNAAFAPGELDKFLKEIKDIKPSIGDDIVAQVSGFCKTFENPKKLFRRTTNSTMSVLEIYSCDNGSLLSNIVSNTVKHSKKEQPPRVLSADMIKDCITQLVKQVDDCRKAALKRKNRI